MGGESTARQRTEGRRRLLAERERKLARLAASQHGVITREQLIDGGLGNRTIERRVERAQLHRLHRGVYALGDPSPGQRGRWLAAVLACGYGALLSHRSAGKLWEIVGGRREEPEVTSSTGRGQEGIRVHEGGVHRDERTLVASIPVTTVARTILDLAEVGGEREVERAFEEADRLGLLSLPELSAVCDRGHGRRGLRPVRRLLEEARAPDGGRTRLEQDMCALCREFGLPAPVTNVSLLGHEVDAFWPAARLAVESDGYEFHRHRAAFERDRARDAAMQAEGYRVVRYTRRRLRREPEIVADELRRLLGLAERGQTAGGGGRAVS